MRVRLKYAALLALPALAHAVSLSAWTPRAENLPPACEAIYTAPIPGCTVKDFTSRTCSQSCLQALEALVEPVKHACAGMGVGGRNLIVAFLANVGPQEICPNAPVMNPTQFGPPPPGRLPPTGSSPTDWRHPSPSASTWSGTTTASSLSPGDSSSLVVDTSSRTSRTHHHPLPPMTKSTSSPTSSTSTTTSSAPSQLNTGDHSGGGSPFDTAGNLGSGAAELSFSAAMAFLSGAAALFVLR